MDGLFKKLSQGGGFSLPYLLHIWNDTMDVHLINSKEDLVYRGVTFHASAFKYLPMMMGESSLDIELVSDDASNLIDIFESGYDFQAEFVGCLMEDGTVQTIANFRHHYAEVTWTGKSAQITFSKDSRWNQTWPALIFNSYNNRGNT